MKHGVTLIELLIVIALIAIIGAATSPFVSRFIQQSNLDTTASNMLGTLRKAQNYSMDGKNDDVWGMCSTGSVIRLYRGECNSPVFSEDFAVPGGITISGITDVTFSKQRGEPSTAGEVILSSQIDTVTISINSAGAIEIQ